MNYKITLEYDGKNYCGWQKQEGLTTIQSTLEEAIYRFCGERIEVIGAGRTDAGVHACGQVANFSITKSYTPNKVMGAINFHLRTIALERNREWINIVKREKYIQHLDFHSLAPFSENDIVVKSCEVVEEDFHARFSAKYRSYYYIILNSRTPSPLMENRVWQVSEPLDAEKMEEASQLLIGKMDFSSFRASQCQAKSPLKTVDSCWFTKDGEKIIFHIRAKSFLHHMVRNIIGTLRMVGNGKLSLEGFKKIIEAKDRTKAGMTAPACGLYLEKIEY